MPEGKLKKVSIICSKGSLDGAYPALFLANGARMGGIEVNVFFTFFGVDAITKKKMKKIRISTVGNPALALPGTSLGMPTWLGAIPGMSAIATAMMKRTMEKLDIPPIDEFIEMISAAGGKLWACKASVDMFGLKEEDFCDEVDGILTVGDFYDLSEGAEIIFT